MEFISCKNYILQKMVEYKQKPNVNHIKLPQTIEHILKNKLYAMT